MIDQQKYTSSVTKAAAWLIILVALISFLKIAADLIIPLIFAILIWYLINTIEQTLARIKLKGFTLPRWLRFIITLLAVALFFNVAIRIISANVTKVVEVAPRYQANFNKLLNNLPFI